MKILVLAPFLLVAACGGDKAPSDASCKDVEAAMRRIEPERTKTIKQGLFEQLCKEKPEEFPPKRRNCAVKAKNAADLKACAEGAAEPPSASAPAAPSASSASIEANSVKQAPKFGVEVDAPNDTKVEERDTNAHIGNGRFKLNLFVVDEYSSASAAAQKASLEKEPGFVKFTTEKSDASSWRFDYELADGKAGTSSRIVVGGMPFDCGVHKVEPAVAAVVATSCATARTLGGAKPAVAPASADAATTAAATKTKAVPKTKTGGTTATNPGPTDREVIGREVKRRLAQVRFCYEKELAKNPKLAGTVTVSFVIGADGAVTSSRASGMGNTNVESCAASVIQRIRFPKPTNPPVSVNYPFAFQPS